MKSTKTTKTQKATKTSKIPSPVTPTPVSTPVVVASKAEKPKAPTVTKKTICIELVSRPGGATLDEIAAEITARIPGTDAKTNRTTASLWMSKIGFPIERDQESGKYSRKA